MARILADGPAQEAPLEKQLWKSADKLRKNIDTVEDMFFVPAEACWPYLLNQAAQLCDANPPSNTSDRSGELLRKDGHWKDGVPPLGSANFAWQQDFLNHLAPNVHADVVLVEVALTSKSGGEGDIRRALVAEPEHVLTPGRYVSLPDEDFNFAERFAALKTEFGAQLLEEARLNAAIAENLAKVKM